MLDSVHAVCPLIDTQSPTKLLDFVKSNRITSWLLAKKEIVMGITTRHYSMVNPRLLQLGKFDMMIELSAPTLSMRYELIKQEICSEELKTKEV